MPRHNNGENKVVLKISGDAIGIFIERKNRFLASVEIDETPHEVHVHDPGRLNELLYPGNRVLLKKYPLGKRKTEWELIAADKNGGWIFTNSKFHRKISETILRDALISPLGSLDSLKAEVRTGRSRIDFLAKKDGRRIWIEVKGCTLEKNGVALFPDAPTARGRRHVEELIHLKEEGDDAAIIFLVFVDAVCFKPNRETDIEFSRAFEKAMKNGVEIYPLMLSYDSRSIRFERIMKLCGEN